MFLSTILDFKAKNRLDIYKSECLDENLNIKKEEPVNKWESSSCFSILVDPPGLEPGTSSLRGICSTNWAKSPYKILKTPVFYI